MGPKRALKAKSEWSERVVAIERVTKVVKGGKKMSFRAIIVVGNEQGKVGVGVGKAGDVITAVRKGVTDGKKHIITVPLTSSNSIPHPTSGRFGAAKLILRPSAPGSGVIAGSSIRTVLELAGIKNILSKHDDFKMDISELEKIMKNFGLCEKILHVADKVVTKFLEDSAVETKIEESNTAHNFFSNQVYGNDMLKIIDRKIGQETEEISFIKKTIFGI